MKSKYFSKREQCCRCGCGAGEDIVSPILLERLDQLREMYGHPIYVSCMYRCYWHNLEVGGVDNSQHRFGTAADIWVEGDYEEFYNLVVSSHLFDAIGHYISDEFVHVDVRDGGLNPNAYFWEE